MVMSSTKILRGDDITQQIWTCRNNLAGYVRHALCVHGWAVNGSVTTAPLGEDRSSLSSLLGDLHTMRSKVGTICV
ncbi:hypothetical protein J6590_037862 [Homalodisca vitripennis]|nr:hypothetical protein J6590_037862 [Homalodisca vitripennis]